MGISQPVLLTDKHVLTEFRCGNPVLDDWLLRRALKNQALKASRTFVSCQTDTNIVAGYYSLASGSVSRHSVSRGMRQNMPEPIPVILLGRLAVDANYQGRKLGQWLLKDAVMRATRVAHHIGVKAVMVHAIDDNARAFYERFGFVQSAIAQDRLFYRL
ncbi:GNAT family N-acetyltransferase [Franconibacter helveticus 513]|uniref:GNAT family N-acetyltransferase n=1 Tax=Franconibacter helveticus TaxID=357240 RepID=UPI00041906A1|nr:GNAT family N-acetyltransferase [Franconibacter helveticus]